MCTTMVLCCPFVKGAAEAAALAGVSVQVGQLLSSFLLSTSFVIQLHSAGYKFCCSMQGSSGELSLPYIQVLAIQVAVDRHPAHSWKGMCSASVAAQGLRLPCRTCDSKAAVIAAAGRPSCTSVLVSAVAAAADKCSSVRDAVVLAAA